MHGTLHKISQWATKGQGWRDGKGATLAAAAWYSAVGTSAGYILMMIIVWRCGGFSY